MTPMRWSIVMALALLVAASPEAGGSGAGGDFAEGALSLLVSKRCESSPARDAAVKGIEWPGLVYGRGKPPAWGRRLAGPCRGLDTWVLSESVAAGAFWTDADHQAIEADPMHTLFDDGK